MPQEIINFIVGCLEFTVLSLLCHQVIYEDTASLKKSIDHRVFIQLVVSLTTDLSVCIIYNSCHRKYREITKSQDVVRVFFNVSTDLSVHQTVACLKISSISWMSREFILSSDDSRLNQNNVYMYTKNHYISGYLECSSDHRMTLWVKEYQIIGSWGGRWREAIID